MELWIRSQDRENLIKVNDRICIKDYGAEYFRQVNIGNFEVGAYRTKERALQILDEIQNILQPTVIYHEPEINYDDMIQSLTENVVLKTTQKVDFELKQAGQIVYQMPED